MPIFRSSSIRYWYLVLLSLAFHFLSSLHLFSTHLHTLFCCPHSHSYIFVLTVIFPISCVLVVETRMVIRYDLSKTQQVPEIHKSDGSAGSHPFNFRFLRFAEGELRMDGFCWTCLWVPPVLLAWEANLSRLIRKSAELLAGQKAKITTWVLAQCPAAAV